MYRVSVEYCNSFQLCKEINDYDRGEITLPMSSLRLSDFMADYLFSSKYPVIEITTYRHEKKQVRRHKKKRINKKWNKKYGPIYMTIKIPVKSYYEVTKKIEDYETGMVTLYFRDFKLRSNLKEYYKGSLSEAIKKCVEGFQCISDAVSKSFISLGKEYGN